MTTDISAPMDPAAGWSARHYGLDPADFPLLASWLRLVWPAGRALARRGVPADTVTVAGVALAAAGAYAARSRPVLALALSVGAAWCDGVDGAVALYSARTTRHGARLDRAADRVSDAALAVTLWRCGAPVRLAAAAGVASLGVEAVREVRGDGARSTVTVGERPTRVICVAAACAGFAVTGAGWPAGAAALVLAGASMVAIGKLVRLPRQAATAA
jgi:CDP-diacylglycerol--glycerol-3-phosphate 3-phosphatidyltransferase